METAGDVDAPAAPHNLLDLGTGPQFPRSGSQNSPIPVFQQIRRADYLFRNYLFLLHVSVTRIVEEFEPDVTRIVENPALGYYPNSRGKLSGITNCCGKRL